LRHRQKQQAPTTTETCYVVIPSQVPESAPYFCGSLLAPPVCRRAKEAPRRVGSFRVLGISILREGLKWRAFLTKISAKKNSLQRVSPKPTRSRVLLASVLAKALWLKGRYASDVSGSDLSNIMTRRISSARVCVKVLQSFSSRTSVSTKRATWGRLGLAGVSLVHLLAKLASPLSRTSAGKDEAGEEFI
jgi:hypothetical protein